jgi:ABC-type glycerol-3-phosphate transport system substrate-binding protein
MQGVEIEFWYVVEPYLEDPLESLVAEFITENRYGMDVISTRFEHPDDLEAAMEEGGLPDVVLAFPYQYNAWVEAGIPFVELSDYLASPNYGLSAVEISEIYPVFLERDVYGGERLGFPGLFYGQTLLYNRTWAQELGYANPPLSDEQFISQACAATQANEDGTGGWMINTQPGGASAWLLAYAKNLESGTGGYQFDIPEVTSAFTFLTELRAADCAWQPSSLYAYDSFAARKGLFYTVSTRDVGAITDAFDTASNRDTWDLIGLPNDRGETGISVYGRSYLVVESHLQQQIGGWMLVAWLTSVESQISLAEEAGYYPLSAEAEEAIRENGVLPRPWVEGLDLLETAYNEPRFSSWRVVRGVVQDAVGEVVRQGFAPGTLSVVIDQFQEIVNGLHYGD